MNAFQVLVVGVLAFLFAGSIVALYRGWSTRRESLIWCALCIIAAAAMLQPELTVRVAHALGIGRGADLVFYTAVVVMMVGFWMVYIRLRYLRRDITTLVRHLAILEARSGLSGSSGRKGPDPIHDRPPTA